SVGAWGLLVFGVFAFVSAAEAWLSDRRGSPVLPLVLNRAFNVVGAVVGIFLASYTGVLLSVSNQPIWSDTWSLGGLFLASGLSGSAALITLLVRRRPEAAASDERLRRADGYFALLEMALIALFLVSLTLAGTLGQALELPWTLLWLLVLASLVPPLAGLVGGPPGVAGASVHGGQLAARRPAVAAASVPLLVLVGVLALRAAVIFSAQT